MAKMKRKPLSKRIPRNLVKNCGKYFGMVVILVCTIAIGSSFQSTLDGAYQYLDDIKEENLQEDGFFETAFQMQEDDSSFYEERGIQLYENFYATENAYQDDCKVIIFNERENIDLPVLFSGSMPKEKDEIVLDHCFANNKNLQIGDKIELLGRELTICGTVSMPDYTSLFLNNTDLVMNVAHFCVATVTQETFESFDEATVTHRYSYRLKDRDLSKAKQLDIAEEMQKHLYGNGEVLQSFLTSQQNQSISFLEMDMGTDGPFMVVFVYLLVALIAFIFAILTNNTIEHESVIIGTLLASGYKKGEIIWHYLQPTLVVGVIGSALGNLLGYTVMIQPMLNIYYTTYSIGPLPVRFSVSAFLMTTILPVAIMIAINCLMLAKKLSLSPLRFLRRDLKKGKQKKAVRLPDFSFLNRFRLRVILQNKSSYIMLFVGIFLTSFLLMFGIGLNPLMEHYTETIDASLPYNYQYILKAPVDTDEGEKVRVYEMDTWFALGKKDIGISLMGIDADSKFFKGAVSGEGVSISSALANKLGLKEGDALHVKDTNEEKEYDLDITSVYAYDAAMAVFFDREELNRMLGDDEELYNCILSEDKIDIDEAYLAKQISRSDLLGAADQMLDSFGTVITFINLFSVVVYIVLMYILTKVVIDKNALSISYMKVFGYEPGEIRKLYLSATTIVVLVSLVICIPVEALLFKFVLIYLSAMIEGYLEFYLPYTIYLEIIVIGVVAYFLINALHVRQVKKIPMTEALKNRE